MHKESRSQFHHEVQAHRCGGTSVVSASVAGATMTAMRLPHLSIIALRENCSPQKVTKMHKKKP